MPTRLGKWLHWLPLQPAHPQPLWEASTHRRRDTISVLLDEHLGSANEFDIDGLPDGSGFSYDAEARAIVGMAMNADVQSSPYVIAVTGISSGGARGDTFQIMVYNEYMNLHIKEDKAPMDTEGNPVEAVLDKWALYATDRRKLTTDTPVEVLDSGKNYDLRRGAWEIRKSTAANTSASWPTCI